MAEENQIVAIAPSSASQGLSALGDFVFRVNLTVDKLIPSGVRLTHEKLAYQRVAILADSLDLFSRSTNDVYSETLTAIGVDIFDDRDVHYPRGRSACPVNSDSGLESGGGSCRGELV